MIKEFTEAWFKNVDVVKAKFAAKHPDDYKEIVKTVVEILGAGGYDDPSPERIHEIDDGNYQGTLLYVIGASGYQPSRYWYVKVGYGSCSVCDTLQSICDYSYEPPTPEQVEQYTTLALHIVQGLREMRDEVV